jgi:hypothetical protein
MKTPNPSRRNVAWLHTQLSAALLVTLLQRTPVLRLLQNAAEIVAASPVGAVLKFAFASATALGAVHTLAGATSQGGTGEEPRLTVAGQPVTTALQVRAGTEITIEFGVSNTIEIGKWEFVDGTLPPGLRLLAKEDLSQLTSPGFLDATTPGMAGGADDPYALPGSGGGNPRTTLILKGTPSQAGDYTFNVRAYQQGMNSVAPPPPEPADKKAGPFPVRVTVAASTQGNTAPTFTTQPAAQTVNAGTTVTLTAGASGTPAPTYQWQKGGTAIAGATNSTLILTNVQPSDSGTYTVVATNGSGSVTSTAAALAINAPTASTPPVMARQPQGQVVANGSTVVFTTEATGAGLTYQWRKNNNPVAGATRSSLVLNGATASDAGSYSAVVTNSIGSVTSSAATLSVVNAINFGHLVNLSIRTSITAADPFFTVGVVVGGAGTSGSKPILVRAVGPSLAAFGLTGAISDSRLDVSAGAAVVASNNDWNGDSALTNAFNAVGAFPFASATSKDAAIFNPTFAARDYTVQVSGVGGATGDVLAELYDATSTNAFNVATPRLVNVSVRKQIDADGALTAGFVIGGDTARTVLVRAIGPGLAAFGVSGAMADPQLALFSGASKIAENDNWGGDPQLTSSGSAVGAFAIANAAGKDAMLLITLAPGSYTAQVSPVTNTGGGSALVEVYEVP